MGASLKMKREMERLAEAWGKKHDYGGRSSHPGCIFDSNDKFVSKGWLRFYRKFRKQIEPERGKTSGITVATSTPAAKRVRRRTKRIASRPVESVAVQNGQAGSLVEVAEQLRAVANLTASMRPEALRAAAESLEKLSRLVSGSSR